MPQVEQHKASHWQLGIVISIIIFLLIWVVLVVFTLFQKRDLVSSDYYSKELTYQKHIERKNNSSRLSVPVKISYSGETKTVEIKFPSNLKHSEITGKATLFRPSDKNQDRQFAIMPDSTGKQTISLHSLKAGAWEIHLEWQVKNVEYYDEAHIILR